MSRRSLLIANAKGEDSGYVQDGLVLFLDGLNQGDEAGKWIDTVNGRKFELYNATQNNGYVTFNSGYARNTENTSFVTIEMVLRIPYGVSSYAAIFTGNTSNWQGVYKNNNSVSFGATSSAPSVLFTTNTIESFSAILGSSAYTDILKNNAQGTAGRGDSWGGGQSGTNLGYYNPYFLQADVFALRLYNRALTSAERTQNYNLDVQRYGM